MTSFLYSIAPLTGICIPTFLSLVPTDLWETKQRSSNKCCVDHNIGNSNLTQSVHIRKSRCIVASFSAYTIRTTKFFFSPGSFQKRSKKQESWKGWKCLKKIIAKIILVSSNVIYLLLRQRFKSLRGCKVFPFLVFCKFLVLKSKDYFQQQL